MSDSKSHSSSSAITNPKHSGDRSGVNDVVDSLNLLQIKPSLFNANDSNNENLLQYTLTAEQSESLFNALTELRDDMQRCGVPRRDNSVLNPHVLVEFYLHDYKKWIPDIKNFTTEEARQAFLANKELQAKLVNVGKHFDVFVEMCKQSQKQRGKLPVNGDYWRNLLLYVGRHEYVRNYVREIESLVKQPHEDFRLMDATLRFYRFLYAPAMPQEPVDDTYVERKGASREAIEAAVKVLLAWEKDIELGMSKPYDMITGAATALRTLLDSTNKATFSTKDFSNVHPFASPMLRYMYYTFYKLQRNREFDRKESDAVEARLHAFYGKEDIPAVPFVKIPWKPNLETQEYTSDVGEFCMNNWPPSLKNPQHHKGFARLGERIIAQALKDRDVDMKHFTSDKMDSISKFLLFGEHLEAVQLMCDDVAVKLPTHAGAGRRKRSSYVDTRNTNYNENKIIVNAGWTIIEMIRKLLADEQRCLWALPDIFIFAFIAFRSAGQLSSPLFNAFINFNTEYRLGPHTQRVQLKCYERSDEKQFIKSAHHFQSVLRSVSQQTGFPERDLEQYVGRMDSVLYIFENALRHVMRLSRIFTLLEATVDAVCLPMYLTVSWLRDALAHGKQEVGRIIDEWNAQLADSISNGGSSKFSSQSLADIHINGASGLDKPFIPYPKRGADIYSKCGSDMRRLVATMCVNLVTSCDRSKRGSYNDAVQFIALIKDLFQNYFFPLAQKHIDVSLQQLKGEAVSIPGVTDKVPSPRLRLHKGAAGTMAVVPQDLVAALVHSDIQEFYRVVGDRMYMRFYDEVMPVLFACTPAIDVMRHSNVVVDYRGAYLPLYVQDESQFGSITLMEKRAVDSRRVKDPFVVESKSESIESVDDSKKDNAPNVDITGVALFDLQYVRFAFREQWLQQKYNMYMHFFTDLRPLGMHATLREYSQVDKAQKPKKEVVPEFVERVVERPQVHEYRDIRFLPRTRNTDKDRQNLRRGRSDVNDWRSSKAQPIASHGKSRW